MQLSERALSRLSHRRQVDLIVQTHPFFTAGKEADSADSSISRRMNRDDRA